MKKILSSVVFMLLGCVLLSAAEFKLMDNGRAVCSIVIRKEADCVEKHAASELSLYLGKISGGKSPAVGLAPVKGTYPIYLELTDDKKVGSEGFKITADKNALRIAGKESVGVLYGAYEILKRYGNIRWLFPGDEGEYFKIKPTIKVPQILLIKNPDFSVRDVVMVSMSSHSPVFETRAWGARNNARFGVGASMAGKHGEKILKYAPILFAGYHSFSPLLNGAYTKKFKSGEYKKFVEKQFAEHPEYYPLINGKRTISYHGGGEPQPCTSNPDVIRIFAENLAQVCRNMGKNSKFEFGNNDYTLWCQCANCKKIDPKEEAERNIVSTRYWTFTNAVMEQVKKLNPDANVFGWTYQNFSEFPKGVKPSKHISHIMISNHRRCWKHPLDDKNCPNNKWYYEYNKKWNSANVPLFTYDMLSRVGREFIPNEKNWVDSLKYYHKHLPNFKGMKTEISCPDGIYYKWKSYSNDNNWYMMWQSMYLAMLFHWDINADYEKAYEEINSLYYGKGWNGGMREFRKYLRSLYMDASGCWGYGQSVPVGKFLDVPGAKEKLYQYLASAEKAASSDPDKRALKHVKRDREYFEKTWVKAYNDYIKNFREIKAYPRMDKIVLDGKLDERSWKDADTVTRFKTAFKEGVAKQQTAVKLTYDKDFLYIGLECLEPSVNKMVSKITGHDGAIWDDNDIELFINDPILGVTYYQILFNAKGVISDGLCNPRFNSSYESNAQVKTSMGKDRWFAEVKIPAGTIFSGIFKPGVVLKMNVMRVRRVYNENGKIDSEYSTWSMGTPNNVSTFHAVNFASPRAVGVNRSAADTRLWKNGSFNEAVKKKKIYAHWKIKDNIIPASWNLSGGKQYGGDLEYLFHEGSTSDRFVRMRKGFIFNFYNIKEGKIVVSCRLRGKGQITFELLRYTAKWSGCGSKKLKTIEVNHKEWKNYSFTFDRPGDKTENQAFTVWPTGKDSEIDVDDVLLMPQ